MNNFDTLKIYNQYVASALSVGDYIMSLEKKVNDLEKDVRQLEKLIFNLFHDKFNVNFKEGQSNE